MEDIIKKLIATNVAAISQLTRQQQQLPPPASPALTNNSLVQLSTGKLCELPANQTCLSTQKILLANITKDYFGNWILFGEVRTIPLFQTHTIMDLYVSKGNSVGIKQVTPTTVCQMQKATGSSPKYSRISFSL
jgi:hypothetical protein